MRSDDFSIPIYKKKKAVLKSKKNKTEEEGQANEVIRLIFGRKKPFAKGKWMNIKT